MLIRVDPFRHYHIVWTARILEEYQHPNGTPVFPTPSPEIARMFLLDECGEVYHIALKRYLSISNPEFMRTTEQEQDEALDEEIGELCDALMMAFRSREMEEKLAVHMRPYNMVAIVDKAVVEGKNIPGVLIQILSNLYFLTDDPLAAFKLRLEYRESKIIERHRMSHKLAEHERWRASCQ